MVNEPPISRRHGLLEQRGESVDVALAGFGRRRLQAGRFIPRGDQPSIGVLIRATRTKEVSEQSAYLAALADFGDHPLSIVHTLQFI